MKLTIMQEKLTAYFLDQRGEAPKDFSPATPPQRLGVYRNLVHNTLASPLRGGYPYTKWALGEALFEKLIWQFHDTHPPKVWELNETTQPFANWLKTEAALKHPKMPPWVFDLARYERLEFVTYLAADEPWKGAPALNPTLTLELMNYDIPTWVKLTNGNLRGSPEKKALTLAIFRDPETLLCRFLTLNAMSAGVLAALIQGVSLEEIIQAYAHNLGIETDAIRNQLRSLLQNLEKKGLVKPI